MRFSNIILLLACTVWFVACGPSEPTYEEVELPTQGLVTELEQVEGDKFTITDEIEIPEYENSLVIANYLDETSDTFTLAEVKLMEQQPGSHMHGSSIFGTLAMGYFGYAMLRNFSGSRPNPSAYRDQKTYQKSQKAGSAVKQTATKSKVSKPSSGKSGYGSKSKSSGGSTRSYGG